MANGTAPPSFDGITTCIHCGLVPVPKSITNKFSSVTENVALNYLQFLRYSKVEVDKIETMIDEMIKYWLDYLCLLN